MEEGRKSRKGKMGRIEKENNGVSIFHISLNNPKKGKGCGGIKKE